MNHSIKALVTGGNGLLGSEVVKKLGGLRIETLPVGRKNFDITDKKASEQFVLNYKPDVIIHCAAYTAVDAAEEDEKNCFAINVTGTRHIAEACKLVDAKMVYISSDYVFNGEGETAQHVDKPTDLINVYQKAGIDKKVIPVTSDAYPARAKRPHNSRLFVDTLTMKSFAQMPDWQDAIERYLNIIKDKEADRRFFR